MKTKFEKAAKEGAVSALEKIKLYRAIAIDAPQGSEMYYRERLSKIKSDTESSKDIGSLCQQWIVAGCPQHLQFEDSLGAWVDNIDNNTTKIIKRISSSNVNSYCKRMDKTNDVDKIKELSTFCLKELEELRKDSDISIADSLLKFWELYYTVKLLEAEIEKVAPVNYKPLWEDLKPYLEIGLADFSLMMQGKPVERKGEWCGKSGDAWEFHLVRPKLTLSDLNKYITFKLAGGKLHDKHRPKQPLKIKKRDILSVFEKHKDLLK